MSRPSLNVNATAWSPAEPYAHGPPIVEHFEQPVPATDFMYSYPFPPTNQFIVEVPGMVEPPMPQILTLGIKAWEIGDSTPPIPSASFSSNDISTHVKSYRDMSSNTHYVLLREDCTPDSDHIYSGFVIPIHDLTDVDVDSLWFGLARQIFGGMALREHNVYGVSLCKRYRNNDLLILWCPQPLNHMYLDILQKIHQQLHALIFASKASRLQPKVQFHLDIFSTVSRRICAVLLMGVPGSGKSTIGKELAKKMQFQFFSAAEALRAVEQRPTESFKPWELQRATYERLAQMLEETRGNTNIRGIILDCQGKTLEDHYYLDSLLRTKCMPLCAAVNFNVDVDREEELIDRACNKGNPKTRDPRAKLPQEKDAVLRDRLRAHRQTEGRILQLYTGSEALFSVDAMRTKEEVITQLETIVGKIARNTSAMTKCPEYPLESHSLTFVDDYEEYASVMDALIRLTNAKKPVFPGTMISGYMSRTTLDARNQQLWDCKVSHKVEGLRFLLVLHLNKLYCVPRHMRCIYNLNAAAWTGTPMMNLQDFVLDAEMVYLNTVFGMEKLIVSDVLSWNGVCTIRLDWDARQQHIANIPDELSIPNPHQSVGVVVVRKHFYALYEIPGLLRDMWLEYPVDGLLFTHKKQYRLSFDEELIHWKNPLSLTADFRVGSIKPKQGVFQVVLEVQEQISEQSKVANPATRTRWRNTDYKEEFVEIEPQVFRHIQLQVGDIIECMLIRDAAPKLAHFWEFLRKRPDKQIANTKEVVETLVREGMVSVPELIDFFQHAPYIPSVPMHPVIAYVDPVNVAPIVHEMKPIVDQCMQCGQFANRGRRDPENKKYYCSSCWEKYGFGDCRQCGGEFFQGQVDPSDGHFYCFQCWDKFQQVKMHKHMEDDFRAQDRQGRSVGVVKGMTEFPYKEVAQVVRAQQVAEAIKLLGAVKRIRVLEIGTSKGEEISKWLSSDILSYLGAELEPSAAEEAKAASLALVQEDVESKKISQAPEVDFIVEADPYSKKFWAEVLPEKQNELFHIISCHMGIHHAFSSVRNAFIVLQGIADSLEPEGVCIGSVIDDTVFYQKYLGNGKKFGNEKYHIILEDSMGIGIGSKYKLIVRAGCECTEHVVPWDRFVSIANSVGLQVQKSFCTSYQERVQKVESVAAGVTREDMDFVAMNRTFVLTKTA
eukprot:PhF_6_TR11668/c0_g1_i1/m.18864